MKYGPLAAALLRAATAVLYDTFTVFQGHLKCGYNAAITAFSACTHILSEPASKAIKSSFLHFQLVM